MAERADRERPRSCLELPKFHLVPQRHPSPADSLC